MSTTDKTEQVVLDHSTILVREGEAVEDVQVRKSEEAFRGRKRPRRWGQKRRLVMRGVLRRLFGRRSLLPLACGEVA